VVLRAGAGRNQKADKRGGETNNLTSATNLWFDAAMQEFLMSLSALSAAWYALRSVPELMQVFGYLFGFLFASWAMDEYF
jgi:hypothetical protein